MGKKEKTMILAVITVILALAGWFLLPEEVIVQISGGEPSSYMSKVAAVVAPTVISALGIALYAGGDGSKDLKNILLTAVGYLIIGFELVANLLIFK